jgi:hypothetical protein
MIAFSCALYNIITGRHFVKYWVPGGGDFHLLFIPWEDRVCKVCQSGEVDTKHHLLTSCEAYSSFRENFLNYMECDPTNEADINEHSLPVEIMKSTDNAWNRDKIIEIISLCLEKITKCLEAMNVNSQ